ncbi:MAG: exodeoxyribonuclease III [Acidobacteriota bacterium]|nr:exodeoxyribonuclease III [Acidobacteriota bacterium]
MRIATWNINGLKARREELVRWLREDRPDVVGMQETKTDDDAFRTHYQPVFEAEGYDAASHGQQGRCGVAILSKEPLTVIREGLPRQEDMGARLLTVETAEVSFTTVYVPSASAEDRSKVERKVKRKLAWLDSLSEHLRERGGKGGPAVLCGDFNIAPEPIDDWKHWHSKGRGKKEPGSRDDERSRIRSLSQAGWADLLRELDPKGRLFSWWGRPNLYLQNKGLRLDLVLGNSAAVDRLQSARIVHGPYENRGRTGKPDHAPVIVDLA